jgi:hypothetical protein
MVSGGSISVMRRNSPEQHCQPTLLFPIKPSRVVAATEMATPLQSFAIGG